MSTGLPELDKVTRGIQPGEIWIVGSGSGHGKTAALVQVTIANCSAGVPVQIFSLEMTGEQILRRILAAVSGVSFYRIRDPRESSPDDMAAIERAAATIEKWPLHIEDACGLTIAKLIAKARLAVRRYGVKLIGVDYVQIVMAPGKEERLRVAAISRSSHSPGQGCTGASCSPFAAGAGRSLLPKSAAPHERFARVFAT